MPGRAVDAVVGAAFGTVVVMAASWALGYAVSASTLPYISSAVRDSTVLARVDNLMPERAGDALRSFTDTLTGDVFPRYLDPFETEIIPDDRPAGRGDAGPEVGPRGARQRRAPARPGGVPARRSRGRASSSPPSAS